MTIANDLYIVQLLVYLRKSQSKDCTSNSGISELTNSRCLSKKIILLAVLIDGTKPLTMSVVGRGGEGPTP